jgi:hypothetical protein
MHDLKVHNRLSQQPYNYNKPTVTGIAKMTSDPMVLKGNSISFQVEWTFTYTKSLSK